MIKAVRGTRDLLPPDTALWNFVESAARDVFRAYNFQEIRTPIFESTELFARGVGEDTDIVSKETFTWKDGENGADFAVFKKWMTTRYPGVKAFEKINVDATVPGQDRKPSLRTELDGKQTFIVFAYRVTFQDFLLLRRYRPSRPRQSPRFR